MHHSIDVKKVKKRIENNDKKRKKRDKNIKNVCKRRVKKRNQ